MEMIPRTREAWILNFLQGFIGKPCPLNQEMGDMLGITRSAAGMTVARMQKKGFLEIETRGKARRIRIKGQWTDWSMQLGSECDSAKAVLEAIEAHVGKPCPSSAQIAAMVRYSLDTVNHAIRALVASGDITMRRASRTARCFGTSKGWTDWTAEGFGEVLDYIPPAPPQELPMPRATCFRCGSSSLHPCRHLQAMGYRRAA